MSYVRGLEIGTSYGNKFSCVATTNAPTYEFNATKKLNNTPFWLTGFIWKSDKVLTSIGFQFTWKLPSLYFSTLNFKF